MSKAAHDKIAKGLNEVRASLSSAPQVTNEAVRIAIETWNWAPDISDWVAMRRVLEQFAASASAVSGKPVAWMHEHPDHKTEYDAFQITDADKAAGWKETPLYAAPSAPVEDAVKAEREAVARKLAGWDGIELHEIRSTVGPAEDANNWRKYLGRADDILCARKP